MPKSLSAIDPRRRFRRPARARRPAGGLLLLIGGAFLALLAAPTRLAAAGPGNDDCLACHDDSSLQRERDGSSVAVDPAAFEATMHGGSGAACTDCHADLAAENTEFPHPQTLAPVACGACHGEIETAHRGSVHTTAKKPDGTQAATCAECHGGHDIAPSSEPASRTNHFKVAETCLRCHADPAVHPLKPGAAPGRSPTYFNDSIHGHALLDAGLNVAPNCTDCHGAHDVVATHDAASPVNRTGAPATCGRCHEKIVLAFQEGVHGQALAAGRPEAPSCADCHTSHGIVQAATSNWQEQVIGECGSCHKEAIRSYRATYHGQVTSLGSTRIATCASCHDAHAIFPSRDERSKVSPANKLETCQQCHQNATAGFALYDPHADPRDKARSPIVYYTARFMTFLLAGVFLFFGMHTALWLPRSFAERRRQRRDPSRDQANPDQEKPS